MSTHKIPFSIYIYKKKNHTKFPKSASKRFFLGTQEGVRNSRSKRVITVRAIEVLLYNVNTGKYLAAIFGPSRETKIVTGSTTSLQIPISSGVLMILS